MIPTGQTKRPPLQPSERRAPVVPISRPLSLPERIEKIVRRGVPVLHIIHYPLKGSNGGVQPGGVGDVPGPRSTRWISSSQFTSWSPSATNPKPTGPALPC